MYVKIKVAHLIISIVLLVGLFGSAVAWAGSPDSPGVPGATNSFTLEDIYQRLNTGAAGAQSTFTEPSSGPGTGTMHTINEIMAVAPAVDDTNGATAADVASGKTFWGLTTAGWGQSTGTGTIATNPAPVPKTGQTASYVTSDDGDLEKGVAWPSPRFTDNGDGTVTDNLTGLIWLKNANCAEATRNWSTALNDVAQLNTDGTMNGNNCGDTSNGGSHQTDWRLPNMRELHSLIDYSQSNPALPSGHPFTIVQSAYYWSSTTYAPDTTDAWGVSMNVGVVNVIYKASTVYVWPVRGGQ